MAASISPPSASPSPAGAPPPSSTGRGSDGVPLPYHLILRHPARIVATLRRLHAIGRVEAEPTPWQIFLGVLRMWRRLVERPESVGESPSDRPRSTLRARLLRRKALRFPFLLREGAVDPLDFTGLGSDAASKIRHLLGAYHPGDNFIYDLEILAAEPGALERLAVLVEEVARGESPRARWLQDLVVYDGYHARLREGLSRALAGDFSAAGDPDDPDTTLRAHVRWCAAQPLTPAASRSNT